MKRAEIRDGVRVAVQNALVQVFPPGDHEIIGYGTGIRLEQVLTALVLPLIPESEDAPEEAADADTETLVYAIREVLTADGLSPQQRLDVIARRIGR